MKSTKLRYLIVLALFASGATAGLLAAQVQTENRNRRPEHRLYKMVDLGTFGGPNAYLPEPTQAIRALNNRGVVAGSADTSTADPFCLNADCLISHTFQWRNGVLTDLGALPGALPGLNGSIPIWINDRGDIVGSSENGKIDPAIGFPEFRAVLWKDGQIIDLGTFGGTVSIAFAVNNRAQVAGFALNAVPDPFPLLGQPFLAAAPVTQSRAFLWQNGEMRDLGTLGGPDAAAFWVNESGQVAGCSLTNATPNPTGKPTADPFLWTKDDGMIDLGTLGGTDGCASDLNNRGQVVGSSNLEGDKTAHPFLWDDGVLTDLGTFGGSFGFPEGINEAGEIVGEAGYPGDVTSHIFHAAFWKNGTITDLGTVDGDPSSVAFHINSKGQVVGASTNSNGEWIHAFLWENGGPMIDLNTVVSLGAGVQLISAPDINDRGEIAALGLLPNGDGHAFLLIPCEERDEGCEDEAEPAATTTQRSPTLNEAQRLTLHRIMTGSRGRMWYRHPIPAHGTAQQ
jgi:probable HAF family extracellular repeat protein